MSGFFNPKFAVLSNWRTTVSQAFQYLRRVSFAIDDSFAFEEFNPQIDFGGMTVTNLVVINSRYIKLNKLLFFSFSLSCTLAVPFTNTIKIRIPGTTIGDSSSALSNFKIQAGGAYVLNPAITSVVGYWTSLPGSNEIGILLNTAVNYAAGTTAIGVNGFVEIN